MDGTCSRITRIRRICSQLWIHTNFDDIFIIKKVVLPSRHFQGNFAIEVFSSITLLLQKISVWAWAAAELATRQFWLAEKQVIRPSLVAAVYQENTSKLL